MTGGVPGLAGVVSRFAAIENSFITVGLAAYVLSNEERRRKLWGLLVVQAIFTGGSWGWDHYIHTRPNSFVQGLENVGKWGGKQLNVAEKNVSDGWNWFQKHVLGGAGVHDKSPSATPPVATSATGASPPAPAAPSVEQHPTLAPGATVAAPVEALHPTFAADKNPITLTETVHPGDGDIRMWQRLGDDAYQQLHDRGYSPEEIAAYFKDGSPMDKLMEARVGGGSHSMYYTAENLSRDSGNYRPGEALNSRRYDDGTVKLNTDGSITHMLRNGSVEKVVNPDGSITRYRGPDMIPTK